MQSIRYLSLPAAPRLRASLYATCCEKNRLRFLEVGGQIIAGESRSTGIAPESDKAFCSSDIQLHNPQIGVLTTPAVKIF